MIWLTSTAMSTSSVVLLPGRAISKFSSAAAVRTSLSLITLALASFLMVVIQVCLMAMCWSSFRAYRLRVGRRRRRLAGLDGAAWDSGCAACLGCSIGSWGLDAAFLSGLIGLRLLRLRN